MSQVRVVPKMSHRLGPACLSLVLASCSAAPSRNIFGSYFPSWMLCALMAMVATAILRWIFIRTGIDRDIRSPVLVYLCILVSFTLGIWLVWLA